MKRILLVAAVLGALNLSAQPKFPQHSTGMPSIQLPAINNHITNLSGSVAGRPGPLPGSPAGMRTGPRIGVRPGYAAPVYVGGGGGYWGGGYAGDGWMQQPIVVVNQQNAAPPAPILVMNPDYKPEVAKPVLTEYSNIRNPYENFTPSAPKVFLLALKDGTLRQSVAFWQEDGTLHFVKPDHKQDKVALLELDRESTTRFNKERGIEIKLPE